MHIPAAFHCSVHASQSQSRRTHSTTQRGHKDLPQQDQPPQKKSRHKKSATGKLLNRGAKNRKSSLVHIRKKACDKYQEYLDTPPNRRPSNIAKTIAQWLRTSQVNVTKWWGKRERYWAHHREVTATRNKDKGSTKHRTQRQLPRMKTGRFPQAENKLDAELEFLEHRSHGFEVNGIWLHLHMKQFCEALYPDTAMKATMG